MTTYLNNYRDEIYKTFYNDQYNGVVHISDGAYGGTGTLLYDGRTILTAAHVVNKAPNQKVNVYFDTQNSSHKIEGSVKIHKSYDTSNTNYDIAIITLDENVPEEYKRYDLYRQTDEINQEFTMVGYGKYGNGMVGEIERNFYENGLKLKTKNKFEADFYDLSLKLNFNWKPLKDSILAADFDSGSSSTDVIGNILDITDKGTGVVEGMIASGDSGGPAFIDDKVAGVASYSVSVPDHDIDTEINSSFGELGAWQRVSYFNEWIDKEVRNTYSDNSKELIVKEPEAHKVTTTYIKINFNENRYIVTESITLDYSTRDGSAIAGEDYKAVSGTVTLYGDERSVLIPIEIIGDNISESNEIFYVDITNPSYKEFDNNIDTFIASRVIQDNEADTQNLSKTDTYYTTQKYINDTFNLSMDVAASKILELVTTDLNRLYNIFVEYKVNNNMVADILQDIKPNLESSDVASFFNKNNYDGDLLGVYNDDLYFIA